MTPAQLAVLLIAAATELKAAGMTLEKDPSENFSDLATLISIAYAENEAGMNIGTGQSTLVDEEGKREVSFGPFQINEFWYKDRADSGDTTVVNNEFTKVFDNASRDDMKTLLQDPKNSALAAIIVANSNNGYENWTTYNKDVYGIQKQDFDSKYWATGFRTATAELYKIDIPETKIDIMEPEDTQPTEQTQPSLGMERRREGYAQREMSRFNKAVTRIAKLVNPSDPENPETIRQIQLSLSDISMEELPQPQRSNYQEVDKVVMNFVAEVGRQKAGVK